MCGGGGGGVQMGDLFSCVSACLSAGVHVACMRVPLCVWCGVCVCVCAVTLVSGSRY